MGAPVTAETDATPAAQLAARTADALRGLGDIVDKLEEQLLTEIAELRGNPALLTTLQSLDLLSQSLAELDALMCRFADNLPPGLAVDDAAIFPQMKLAALRACVMGITDMAASDDVQTKGDVALF